MDISSFFFNNGCVVVKLNSVACGNLLLAGRPLRHAQASPFILQAARLYPLQHVYSLHSCSTGTSVNGTDRSLIATAPPHCTSCACVCVSPCHVKVGCRNLTGVDAANVFAYFTTAKYVRLNGTAIVPFQLNLCEQINQKLIIDKL